MEAYSKMGWSHQQLEAMSMNPMFRGNTILWWSMTFMVLYLGFLLWLKRYFRAPAPPSYTGLSDSISNPLQPGS
jgi:cytochrome c-type biogenesis protein CcmH/NrfF